MVADVEIVMSVPAVSPADLPILRHRLGELEVGLASAREIDEALQLRYRVFCEERGASANSPVHGLEEDAYDRDCDHLIVRDHARPGAPVVGTYRLLRELIATRVGGFYSASEYNLGPLLARGLASGSGAQLLELGRSCVDLPYRTNGTITLLWRAIASYLEVHRIGFMFGCASFAGIDPTAHYDELAYLHRFHLAPKELRVRALAQHHVPMDDGGGARDLSGRSLPPLIKAYLRVGAKVGDGAFVDHAFNTVDVFMIMPVERIVGRYGQRFGLVRN